MKLSDIKEGVILTGESASNYQIDTTKEKRFYNSCRVLSVKKYYKSALKRNVTEVFFMPLIDCKPAHFLVSSATITEFKRKFKIIINP